jgi:formylmethanofuran dehydrogenase subunit E
VDKEKQKLEKEIEKAVELHGHLGPFLVIGVRMATVAKKNMKLDVEKHKGLRVAVKVPLVTPFSCVIDGIQSATACTVGNQKLKIENSEKEIITRFRVEETGEEMKISLSQKLVDELKRKMLEGVSAEELAIQIAAKPEEQIFTIAKQ